MAWELRCHKRYYYRSRRVGDRVLKQYLGRGPAAEAAAREDEEKQAARVARRYAAAIEKAQAEPARELLAELNGQVTMAVHTALTAAGYHRHGGEWRKRGATGKRRRHRTSTTDEKR
jgi:hypothetical protein